MIWHRQTVNNLRRAAVTRKGWRCTSGDQQAIVWRPAMLKLTGTPGIEACDFFLGAEHPFDQFFL
jgi:hypothetical protein